MKERRISHEEDHLVHPTTTLFSPSRKANAHHGFHHFLELHYRGGFVY